MDPALTALVEWLRSLPLYASVTVLVGASLVGSWAVTVFGFRLLRRVVRGTQTAFDDIVFEELRLPVTVTVALAGVYVAGRWLVFEGQSGFYVQGGAMTVLLLVWTRAAVRLGDRLIRAVDERSDATTEFAPIFENLWTFVVLVGSLFVLLRVWDVDVTPLLASAGIAGIAVGFAARDTVANFFGSIALYVDDTYAVGDYVELDDGTAGTVLDVSIRSTRLLTRDNVVVTVPNSVLNSARIVNRSAPQLETRVKVPVGVAYGSDVDEVTDILLDVATAEPLVCENPQPRVRFRGFGDSALDLELLCWVNSPLSDGRAVHELNRAIYERFTDAGVEIPFPQRAVRVVGADPAHSDGVGDAPSAAVGRSEGQP